MSKVIIDTSLLINHIRGTSADFTLLESKKDAENLQLCIPYIVIVELFTGEEAKRKRVREILMKLIKDLSIVDLTVASAIKAGELNRVYKQIPDLPDLIIAAIAIEHEAQIATHNQKHFKQIRGVRLFKF
jgi:predicted nucleic acid-binding protein